MLSTKIEDAFNEQLNKELFSAYLYLSMSSWFDTQNLGGMAQWMRLQAQEELQHAMKFYDFVLNRDGRVTLSQIDTPKKEWESALTVFQEAYDHERMITGSINDLVNLSLEERDHAAVAFLQWFVTEQVEEEATVQRIAEKLRMVGDDKVATLILDSELNQRSQAGEATE